jgi:hypothetical protein
MPNLQNITPGNVTLQLFPVQDSLQLQIANGPVGPRGEQGTPGVVQEMQAGDGIHVNSLNPANPVVSSTLGVLSVTEFGAVGNGSTDDSASFDDAVNDGVALRVPAASSSYRLDTDVVWPNGDGSIQIDPLATFSGSGQLDVMGLMQRHTNPVFCLDTYRKTYGSDFSGYNNIFTRAGQSVIADHADSPARVVDLYAFVEVLRSGKSGWSFNTAAYASASGAIAIGYELDIGILASGGIAYGLVIANTGGPYTAENAILISGNNEDALFKDAIFIDNGDQALVVRDLFRSLGNDCDRGLYFTGAFEFAEIDIPSFLVDATPAGISSRLRLSGSVSGNVIARVVATGDTPATNAGLSLQTLGTGTIQFYTNTSLEQVRIPNIASAVERIELRGAASGSHPLILAAGSSTDINMDVRGKGAGGGRLLDGGGAVRVAVSTSGIVFGVAGTNAGVIDLSGATSGTTKIQPAAVASGTLTLPAATDTLVGRATTDTLTNKTLTAPVINSPTGIVKGDVGLGNVDNTSDATKDAAVATLTNKTLTSPVISTGLSVSNTTTGRAVSAALKAPYILAASAVAVPHTGDTNETTLATVTIPANAMGANGAIRVHAVFSYTNSGNNKVPRIRFGGLSGTQYKANTVTTTASAQIISWIQNRNATNSQVGPFNSVNSVGLSAASPVTSSVDTTAAVDLVFTGQLTNTGETITLESYIVELLVP